MPLSRAEVRRAAAAEAADLLYAHLSVGGALHGPRVDDASDALGAQLDYDSAEYRAVSDELNAIAERLWAQGRPPAPVETMRPDRREYFGADA